MIVFKSVCSIVAVKQGFDVAGAAPSQAWVQASWQAALSQDQVQISWWGHVKGQVQVSWPLQAQRLQKIEKRFDDATYVDA